VVTKVLRALVGRLAGRPIRDANVPCKLVSASLLADALPLLPDDTFAPSVGLVVVALARPDHPRCRWCTGRAPRHVQPQAPSPGLGPVDLDARRWRFARSLR
jgi:hypothetical protein